MVLFFVLFYEFSGIVNEVGFRRHSFDEHFGIGLVGGDDGHRLDPEESLQERLCLPVVHDPVEFDVVSLS